MTAAVEPRANLPGLTGMRGIAAWFVVLYHIRAAAAGQLPEDVLAFLSKGYLAVDLFFMLSGFVLWLNYSDRLREQGLAAAPAFLARRIARIWPLHVAILAGAVLIAAVLSVAGRPADDQYPWAELPLHILLMQNWGFTRDLTWNDPAWSISCEFAAYLLFPLLAVTANWRRLPVWSLVALVALLTAALHLPMSALGASTLGDDIPRFGLLRALTEFAIGTIICALWQKCQHGPMPLLISVAAATAAATATLAGLPETLGVPPLLAALLLAAALCGSSARNPLTWRPLHYLGEISYATYLLHFLLFKLFKLLFVNDPTNAPLPLLGLFLLLTFLGSVLLHHRVERPAQRLLNRAFDACARPSRPRPVA